MFTRYAIFYTFPSSPIADFCAAWLGWDIARGVAIAHPKLDELDVAAITDVPRKYGAHGTIKPPFVLADGMTQSGLLDAVANLCGNTQAVAMDKLELASLGRFLALCPLCETQALTNLAAQVVRDLDRFRAPMSADELARRSSANLTQTQQTNLNIWGYPHVMDAFKFHITLTGRLDKQTLTQVKSTLEPMITPLLPQPFHIDSLTLVGQREDGMFEQIQRYPLAP